MKAPGYPRPLDLNDIPEEDGIPCDPTMGRRSDRAARPKRGGRAYTPPEDEHGTLTEEGEGHWDEDTSEEE